MRPDVRLALERLEEIHLQVARGAHFRGYRAFPVASMGLIALVAAASEALWAPALAPWPHALLWLGVAAFCATLGFVDLWLRRQHVSGRDSWIAVGQLLPALTVGLAATWLLADRAEMLPGLWTALFGLGVLASRPFLPAGILGVALFYVATGLAMAAAARAGAAPGPWAMGLTFLIGQLTCAAILRRSAGEDAR